MNGLIIASIIINAVVSIGVGQNYPEDQGAIIAVLACFVVLSIIGAVMIASGSKKPGAILVTIGCIVFVPIGLIGVFGAKKVLDEVKRETFQRGRAGA